MWPDAFIARCDALMKNGFLRSSRYVKVTEQVAVFCLIMAHNWSQRDVADRLQRSHYIPSAYTVEGRARPFVGWVHSDVDATPSRRSKWRLLLVVYCEYRVPNYYNMFQTIVVYSTYCSILLTHY